MNHPIDQIESYIAGGLTADEQAAFELHVAQCPPCSAALSEAQAADAAMNDLFADARPATGFEDRVIASLTARPALPVPRRIHPIVRRVAVGLAASLMLGVSGLVGYLAEYTATPQGQNVKVANARRMAAQAPVALAVSPTTNPSLLWSTGPDQSRGHADDATAFEKTTPALVPAATEVPAAPAEPTPAAMDSDAGQDHYVHGVEAYRSGKWDEAREDFAAAIKNGYTGKPGLFSQSATEYLKRMDRREQAASASLTALAPASSAHDFAAEAALNSHAGAADLARAQATRKSIELVKLAREAQLSAQDGTQLSQARELYTQAVHEDPSNAAAQAGLDEVLTLEGRNAKTFNALDTIGNQMRVRSQEITYRYDTSIKEAKQAAAEHKYDVAAAAIQRAELAASADRKIFPRETLDQFDHELKSVKLQLEQLADSRPNEQGRQIIHEERQRAELERQNTIKDLRKTAIDLTKQNRFREAIGVVDQITQLDPKDEYAIGVKPVLEDRAQFRSYFANYDGRNRLIGNQLNRADEHVVPYDDVLRYPADWPDISTNFALGDLNGPAIDRGFRLKPGDSVASDRLYFRARNPASSSDVSLGLLGGLDKSKPQDGSSVGWTDYAYTGGGQKFKAQDRPPVADHWGTATEAGAVPNTGLSVTGSTTAVPAITGKTANTLTTAIDPNAGKPNDQPQPAVPFNLKPNITLALADNPPPTVESPQATKPAVRASGEAVVKPKIIRTGDMDFEVESFDTAVATITKIVGEETGYVSTTNSEKLPNGKVKGSVILRVAPEHLDTLVLKLRGIGDLRTQHIAAQDITKQYTDMQSRLRAAQIMQERLLDMIKNGKGAVKDLLEAEKQLGIVRENIEQMEGEIRFYDHQVSLSTLTLTLFERDIRTPAVATETDAVTMAVETKAVTEADVKAKEAIAQAKGRIITASLTQDNSGKLMSTIVAQVPPDAADACIGRLKQIAGQIANFNRQRNQTTSNGSSPVDSKMADPIKLKREDVTINLTIYNLANYDARRWTTVTLVVPNVEETDRLLKEQVRLAGGRMLESQIKHPSPDQTAGSLKFDVPMGKADAVLLSLRGLGEALQVNTSENAGTQNATESKRGFIILFGTLSAFQPREKQTIELASLDVKSAFENLHKLLETSSARILASHLDERDRAGNIGTLDFEIARASVPTLEQAMKKDGQVVTRLADHKTDAENMVDAKVHFIVTIGNSEQLPARQSTDLGLEVPDSQAAMNALQAAALSAGGRQVDTPQLTQTDTGQTTATLTLDIPLEQLPALISRTESAGVRKSLKTSIDAHAPEGKLARARLTVTFTTPATSLAGEESMSAGISHGLHTSMRWARNVLVPIIVGLCIVLPLLIVFWIGWKGVRWTRRHFGAVAMKPNP